MTAFAAVRVWRGSRVRRGSPTPPKRPTEGLQRFRETSGRRRWLGRRPATAHQHLSAMGAGEGAGVAAQFQMVQGESDGRRLSRLAGIPQCGQQRRRIVGHRLGRCREVSEPSVLRRRVPHRHRHAGVLPGGDQVAIRLPFAGDDLIRAACAVHEQLARDQDFIGRILSGIKQSQRAADKSLFRQLG